MSRHRLPATGPVPLAELELEHEQDVVDLCRRAREEGGRLGLDEQAVQRLCAAAFEVAQQLQAAAPGTRAALHLVNGSGLDASFAVDRPQRVGGTGALQAVLDPVSSVVPRASLARRPDDGVEIRIGVDLTALAVPGPSPSLAQLLDSVQDYAICLLTTDGQVLSTNAGAERLFDCPSGEMVGGSFEQFYVAADRAAGVPATQLVGAQRAGRFESAVRLRRRAGAFDAHLIIVPVRDEAEVLRGFSFVVRDITERLGLEADLRRRAEELAAANRAKEDFLATLSHELRTPLNAMLGWTRLLRMGKLDAAGVERALETIERNAHLQEQLISDILDVSRIVTGKLRVSLRPVDLAPIVDASIDSVRPTAAAKGIALTAQLAAPGPVHGDPDRLQQVVWNLLANAIKFTPPGGEVRLELSQRPDAVVVSVADTGQGIAPDLLPYIFDRFRQGDASATRSHGGIGLGLSIVRHIVELHGGQVMARSAGAGTGTTFTVQLPLRRPSPTSRATAS